MTKEDPERLTKLHENGRNRSKHLEKTDSKLSQKLREILEKIKCTWKNLCDKIKNIADKKIKFWSSWNRKIIKQLLHVAKGTGLGEAFLKPKKASRKTAFWF